MHRTLGAKAVALVLLLSSCFFVSEAGWFKQAQSASLKPNGTTDDKPSFGTAKNKTLTVTVQNETLIEVSNQTTGGLLGRKGGLEDVGGAVPGRNSKAKPKKEATQGGWFGKSGGSKTGGPEGIFEEAEDQKLLEGREESEIEAKTMPGSKGTLTNESSDPVEKGPANNKIGKKSSRSKAGTPSKKVEAKRKSAKKKSVIEEGTDPELKPFELNSTAVRNMTSVDGLRPPKVQTSKNASASEETAEERGKAWALGWVTHQKGGAKDSSQAMGTSALQVSISKALGNKTREVTLDEEELAGNEEDEYAGEDKEEESAVRIGVRKDKQREGAKGSGVVTRKGEEEIGEESFVKQKGKKGKASKGSGVVTARGESDEEEASKERTGLPKGKGGKGTKRSGIATQKDELDGEEVTEKSSGLQKDKRVENVKGSGVVPRKGGILGAMSQAVTGTAAGEEEEAGDDEEEEEEEEEEEAVKKNNVRGWGTNFTSAFKNVTSSGLLGTANVSDAVKVPVKKAGFWGQLVGGPQEDELDEESEEELEGGLFKQEGGSSNWTKAMPSARDASKNAKEGEERDESEDDEYEEEGLETEVVKGGLSLGNWKGTVTAKTKNVTGEGPDEVPKRSSAKGKQPQGRLGKKAADALVNVTKPLGRLFSAAANATQNATTPGNSSMLATVRSKVAEAKKETASIMKNITRVSPLKRNSTQNKTERTQDKDEKTQDKPRKSKTDKKGSKSLDIQAVANKTIGVISNQTGVQPNPERAFGGTGAGRFNGSAEDWPGYEDEYDSPFVNNLFNKDTLGAVQEQAKTHLVPQVQALSQATSDAYDSTHKQIRTKLDGVVGPKASGVTATVVVILLISVPGAAVLYMCRKLKAVFSLQMFIFVCAVYLALQSLILTLFALVHKEPLGLFQRNFPDAYVLYQFVSLLAFVIFLALCTMSFSAAFRTGELMQKILGVGQLLPPLGVGLHYFGAIWQPAMMDKPPHVTWTAYGLYTLAFTCVCVITWFRRSRHEVLAVGGSTYKQL